MTLISGASQYLSQSILAGKTGSTYQPASLLGDSSGNLLDVGRRTAAGGVGLSSNARALNKQALQNSSSLYNGLFSLAGGGSSTIEAALTQIRGLMASVPVSRDASAAREASKAGQEGLEKIAGIGTESADASSETSSSRGSVVNESV